VLTKTRDVIASATDVYRVSRDIGRSFSKAYRLYFADKDIYMIQYFYRKIEIICLFIFCLQHVYKHLLQFMWSQKDRIQMEHVKYMYYTTRHSRLHMLYLFSCVLDFFLSCLWSDQYEYVASFMIFSLWIGPGFIFESCS